MITEEMIEVGYRASLFASKGEVRKILTAALSASPAGVRVETPPPAPNVAVAAREFMSATEALLDWMNNTELAADHKRQQPEDFDRLCTTMLSLRAVLATTEGQP